MFYLNIGYRWSHQSLDRLEGAILLPHGSSIERVERERPEVRNLLFDPQLYLAGLDCGSCAKVCARLVSYPWFGAEGVPTFDGDAMKKTDWQKSVRDSIADHWLGSPVEIEEARDACDSAIEFQEDLQCSLIILPSPMISEREDYAATQGAWLDAGLEAAEQRETELPLLATVAVSDIVLNEAGFEDFGILDTVVDQVTSRDGIDGVYIVVAQANAAHPFDSPRTVLRAYRYLSKAFADAGYEYVITNFADVYGLACYSVGATGFATGHSHGLRRLSMTSFDDEGFGIALPYLYSHPVVAEFASETDLNVIRDSGLLRRVRDITPSSERLMSVLASGGSASSVAAWAESRNNVNAAQSHFLSRMVLADEELGDSPADERADNVKDWLENAAATMLLIKERIGAGAYSELKAHIAPAPTWSSILGL